MTTDEEEEDEHPDITLPEGKVGAKKLRKLQEKAEKRANREAELQEREERREREKLLDEQRKKEDAKREAEEARLVNIYFSNSCIVPIWKVATFTWHLVIS